MELPELEIEAGLRGKTARFKGHLFSITWSDFLGLVCLEAEIVNKHLEHDLKRRGLADKVWVSIENTFDAALTKLQDYIAEDLSRQQRLF